MRKEKQRDMGTAEAGAHDLFVVLDLGRGVVRTTTETLERAR